MTEACKSVIDFAFSILHVKRIHTHHHVDNSASGHVQRNCGMRFIRTAYKKVADCEQISGDYYYEIGLDDYAKNYSYKT